MSDGPILLAVTSTGDRWEDPSEDLLYMLLEDLVEAGGGSFRVDKSYAGDGHTMEVVLDGEVFRVRKQDGPDAASVMAESSELREVHAACTRWAHEVDDVRAMVAMWGGFDGTLPWRAG